MSFYTDRQCPTTGVVSVFMATYKAAVVALLTPELREKLREIAHKNKRSLAMEASWALEQHINRSANPLVSYATYNPISASGTSFTVSTPDTPELEEGSE